MELSPEEVAHIEAEERYRKKIREKDSQKSKLGCGGIIGSIFLLIVVISFFNCSKSAIFSPQLQLKFPCYL